MAVGGRSKKPRLSALSVAHKARFDCDSGADVFHEQYGLSRWLGSALGRRKVKADKLCDVAQKALNKADIDEQAALEIQQLEAIAARVRIDKAKQDYHENLLGITDDLHPFSLEDNTHNTAASITLTLEKRAVVFEVIAVQQDIPDKHNALRKFRGQVAALASHVSFWWLWVDEILLDTAVDEPTRQWLTGTLLPVIYWHHQLHKTKNQARVNVTGKHGSVPLKTLMLILSMRTWLNVNNNGGWSGQNGWYGNTIVAHPLLKDAMAASPNSIITGEV